jgi:ABC-type transporter Mla subunit MlaD
MDTIWVVLIAVVAALVLVALARWFLAGGRRRDPGRVVPEAEERPTTRR